jgi:predicted dehydrogenase
MNDAAKKAKKLLQVGFVNRYTTSGVAAKKLVEAGRVGNIYHLKANIYRRRGIPGLGGWFTTKALSGGGPMIDLGVHAIDLITYIAGQPKPLRASGKVYDYFGKDMKKYVYEGMWAGPPRYDGTFDVEDSAHAMVRLAPEITLEVNVTWAGNFPDESVKNVMGVFGDKGGVTFELGGKEVTLATEEDGMNVDIKPKLVPVNPWDSQCHAFVEAIKTRKIGHADGRSGLYVQSILDAIYKSSAANKEVEIKG